jgi:hypothetical protein
MMGDIEEWSTEMLAREIRSVSRLLRWEPRDVMTKIERQMAKIRHIKDDLARLDVGLSEAKWKAHRYRFVPLVGDHWSRKLKSLREQEDVVKARLKFEQARLEKLRRRQDKREVWRAAHADDFAYREELRNERQARVEKLGREKLGYLPDSRLTQSAQEKVQRAGEEEIRRIRRQERRRQQHLGPSWAG